MKEKGFTLIELLAVIVILAIIALIATPVVLNIIKSSKGSSIERSAELYLDQVKNEIARYNMNHPGANFNPSICEVQGNGVKCDDNAEIIPVEINGDKPEDGSKIILSNGSVTGVEDFKVGSKSLTYENGKIKEGESSASKTICKAVTTATTGNVPTGNFNYGDEYICDVGDDTEKIFFVLENSEDNVSLIMNANVGIDGKAVTSSSTNKSLVAWITKEDYIAAGGTESDWGTDGNNDKGPITVTKALKEYTSTWTNLPQSQITLPTYDQIYTASGNKQSSLSTWLYDYLIGKANSVSGVQGYWTVSPSAVYSNSAWKVSHLGKLTNFNVSITSNTGIRPVITISKSYIQ